MCGDLDDHDRVDDQLFERFIAMAGSFGVTPGQPDGNAPVRLA